MQKVGFAAVRSVHPLCAIIATIVIPFGVSAATARGQCASDIDQLNGTDSIDLAILLATHGTDGGEHPRADINGDGVVDFADLAHLLAGWGPCPPPLPWATTLEQDPDPLVVTDKAIRTRMIETNLPWRVRDNATGIEMLLVPPGSFTMGASPGDAEAAPNEHPSHEVTLTSAFYLGRTEVTQAIWLAEMGSNPSYFTGDLDHPVEYVSWNAVRVFCVQNELQLPTEAQWEYACRAGDTTPRYGPLDEIAWNFANSEQMTHPVATKLPNGFGFYGTIGNVSEWCSDFGGPYSEGSATDPTGPATGIFRVLRGGAWISQSSSCRASFRAQSAQTVVTPASGFRVARNP